MEDQKINFKWLKTELKQLNKTTLGTNHITSFRCKICTTMQKLLTTKQMWELEEFYALASAFLYLDNLLTDIHLVPSIHSHERRQGCMYKRYPQILHIDIDNALKKLKIYEKTKFALIKKKAAKGKIPKRLSPNEWLNYFAETKEDLITIDCTMLRYDEINDSWSMPEKIITHPIFFNHFINSFLILKFSPRRTIERETSCGSKSIITHEFEKNIRFHAFHLSHEEEEHYSTYTPMFYTLEELTIRWKTNKENIISYCLTSSLFHPYIILTKDMRLDAFILKRTVAFLPEEISSGKVDPNYRYQYKKCVRLAKTAFIKDGITFEYFYAETIVQAKKTELSLIWINPPLSVRVLGVYAQRIDIKKDIQPTIFFIKDEIDLVEKSDSFLKQFHKLSFENKKSPSKANAKKFGKLSGEVRKEVADQLWKKMKGNLLNIAKENAPTTANFIATRAAESSLKVIRKSQISNIAKKIRSDKEFASYLK